MWKLCLCRTWIKCELLECEPSLQHFGPAVDTFMLGLLENFHISFKGFKLVWATLPGFFPPFSFLCSQTVILINSSWLCQCFLHYEFPLLSGEATAFFRTAVFVKLMSLLFGQIEQMRVDISWCLQTANWSREIGWMTFFKKSSLFHSAG